MGFNVRHTVECTEIKRRKPLFFCPNAKMWAAGAAAPSEPNLKLHDKTRGFPCADRVSE
jgi:hypothetical protein